MSSPTNFILYLFKLDSAKKKFLMATARLHFEMYAIHIGTSKTQSSNHRTQFDNNSFLPWKLPLTKNSPPGKFLLQNSRTRKVLDRNCPNRNCQDGNCPRWKFPVWKFYWVRNVKVGNFPGRKWAITPFCWELSRLRYVRLRTVRSGNFVSANFKLIKHCRIDVCKLRIEVLYLLNFIFQLPNWVL